MGKTERTAFAIIFSEVISVELTQIGKFLAELRKESGLTQEQLGEKLGVTNKTVSRWETGAYLPPRKSITRDIISLYASEDIVPAQGAGHWPIS